MTRKNPLQRVAASSRSNPDWYGTRMVQARRSNFKGDDQDKKSRDVWEDSYHRQEFEHELIDRKTTWGLTSQTILFTAYGVTLGGNNASKNSDLAAISNDFRKVVILAGLFIAAVTFVAVVATINSKRLSWRQYEEFYDHHPSLKGPLVKEPFQWGVSTPNTIVTMALEAFLPLIFFGAWLYLLKHSSTAVILTIGSIVAVIIATGVIVGWSAKRRQKPKVKRKGPWPPLLRRLRERRTLGRRVTDTKLGPGRARGSEP